MKKKSAENSAPKRQRHKAVTKTMAAQTMLAAASESVTDAKDYVVGPSQDQNFPDISAFEKMHFADDISVYLPPVIEEVLSSTRYAKEYAVTDDSEIVYKKTLAPLKLTTGSLGILEDRHKKRLDSKVSNGDDLRFIADEMTGFGNSIKGCGNSDNPQDGVPLSALSAYHKQCALNARAVEDYVKTLDVEIPDYIAANHDRQYGSRNQANFIKWGSFCLSDQFDLNSNAMKSIVDSEGCVSLSSMTFQSHSADAFYGTRNAYLFVYEYTNETSAISSDEMQGWQYFKNQPGQYAIPLCSSDNFFSNDEYTDELSDYKFVFSSQPLRINASKDYIFKIADSAQNNNLEKPLRSDFEDEEQASMYGPPFQLSSDPCISLAALVTDNQKDFLFFNALDNNEYVHRWNIEEQPADHPLGKQVYIKSIEGIYYNKPDTTNVISSDYIIIQDQKAVDSETDKPKLWKLTVKKYDEYEDIVAVEEIPDFDEFCRNLTQD